MLSIVGRMVSIDKMKREIGLWKRQAESDALTKLGNRAYGERLLQQMLCEPQKEKAAVMFLDVDNFKMVNDRHGHLFGDEVLCRIANEISKQFRIDDIVCRIGGDEFAVIAAAADEDAVKAAVETLRRLCAEWDAKEEYPVSIAVGYAMQAGRTMTADELFMEADAAMYRNKAEIKKAVGGISR